MAIPTAVLDAWVGGDLAAFEARGFFAVIPTSALDSSAEVPVHVVPRGIIFDHSLRPSVS